MNAPAVRVEPLFTVWVGTEWAGEFRELDAALGEAAQVAWHRRRDVVVHDARDGRRLRVSVSGPVRDGAS